MKEVVKEEKRAQIKVQENQKESGMANSQNLSLNLFCLSYTLIFFPYTEQLMKSAQDFSLHSESGYTFKAQYKGTLLKYFQIQR